jgi:hypothetical protein
MEGFASLRVAIRNHIDGHASRPFAVLDFDGTCIVNDVAEATLAYICRNRLLRRGDLLFSRTQSCSPAYHQQVFRHYYELLHRDDIQSASLLCARAFAGFAGNEARYLVTAAIHAEGSIPGMTELYGVSIARGLAVRPVMRRLIDFLNAIDVQLDCERFSGNRSGNGHAALRPSRKFDSASKQAG